MDGRVLIGSSQSLVTGHAHAHHAKPSEQCRSCTTSACTLSRCSQPDSLSAALQLFLQELLRCTHTSGVPGRAQYMAANHAPGPSTVLRAHRAEVQAVCCHPNHDLLYSGDADGEVKVWDLFAQRPRQSQREPFQEIRTGSYNFCRMALYIIDIQMTECLENDNAQINADMQRRQVQPSKYCPGVIAIAGYDPAVLAIWNLKTGTCIDQLAQPPGVKHGMCMAVHLYMPPGTTQLHALVGYEDGELSIWNVVSGQILASKHLHDEPVMAVAVDATGTGGLCAAADNKIHRFLLYPEEQLLELQGTLEVKQQGIADLAIRQDQRIFASAGWDNKIRVFNYAKSKPLAILQYHKKGVSALAFHPKDQRLISASRDGNIAIWSIFQGTGPQQTVALKQTV